MSSKWTFIGGVLAGIAGVFIAMELENQKNGNHDAVDESEKLALPESEG